MKRITAAAAAFVLMCQPVSVSALSSTSHGYGQGTQTDSSNCPLGASDFSHIYGKFDAFALSEEPERIILTFDQGYENGYTEKILDTLKEKNVKYIKGYSVTISCRLVKSSHPVRCANTV